MIFIASLPRLLEEIVERDPDIVGLEEVDDFAFFQSNLSRLGYVGFHVLKVYRKGEV